MNTQQRFLKIKSILRGLIAIKNFDMINGSIRLKEEAAQTLAMAIVIDFEKEDDNVTS